jgi:FkbM family methyltransferase
MNILNKIVFKAKIKYRFYYNLYFNKRVKDYTIPKALIKKYVPKRSIIIDAGANNGGDSIEWAKFIRGSKIYAFEPIPEVYKSLKWNTRKYKNISCYQLALSNTTGIAKMFVSSGESDGSSSLLKPSDHLIDHPEVKFDTSIEVPTITLDDWCEQNKIDHIDMLWLDMQGFELNMLKASKKILQTVKVIHIEVSTKSTYENVPLYPEVKSWLENKGFKVAIEAIPVNWDFGNVLFIKA